MSRRCELIVLLAILAVAAILRLLWLDGYPPGWHHDEALMGVMASEVYQGISRPIFFPGYLGQEPLYIYLSAGMMALLGGNQDILPLRLTSALVGIATVYVAYLMAKEMFDRRVGLLTAAFLATNFWQVMSSRNGYRSITQPLVEGLAVYCLWRGRRTHSTVWYAAAGAAAAAATYTYLGGRTFPAVLVAFGLWSLIFRPRPSWAALRRAVVLASAAVLVALPIYLYWLANPGTFDARMSQVFILSPAVNNGEPLLYLSDSLSKALQLFTVRGEMMWRYNLPGRPIFVWALVPAFYFGVGIALRRLWRRDCAIAFLLIWIGVMFFPSILSYDVGGYTLRGMGLVPAVYVFPAVGAIAFWDWLGARTRPRRLLSTGVPILLGLVVAFDGGLSYRNYFVDWSQDFGAAYEGDAHVVAEARYLAAEAKPDREEVFAGSDYRGHPIVSHLAPNVYKELRWLDGSQSIVYSPYLTRDSLYVLSFTTMPEPPIERYFPLESFVTEQRFDRGIVPGDPPPKFLAYRLTPAQVRSAVDKWLGGPSTLPERASFGGDIEVISAQVEPRVVTQTGRLRVTVVWRVLRKPSHDDYVFFSHLLDERAVMWAQSDRNRYPTLEWRPGDVVVGRYDLTVAPETPPGKYLVDFGLYDRRDNVRIPVIDSRQERTTAVVGTEIKVLPLSMPTPDSVAHRLERPVGTDFELMGFDVARQQGEQGAGGLDVTLLWRALGRPVEDYTVFVQLLNPEGKLVAQSDAMPAANRFPTSIWDPGDVVTDTHRIALDSSLPAGDYQLIAGMYLLRTGQRLPTGDPGDYVRLRDIALPPR